MTRRLRKTPDERRRDRAVAAAGRCFRDLYGTTKAMSLWSAVERRINENDPSLVMELRRQSEHAVRMVVGEVPPGAEWSGFNALVAEPRYFSPYCGIVRRMLQGETRKDIERRIRQKVEETRKN